jgi:UDP-N-acetylmuramyl tripeptide synthase
MSKAFVTILGKTVKHVARLRGGGSALPGLIVERIDPDFVKHCLKSLPLGVLVVSGTNGKTTTTKIIVELLQGQGLKVFTNRTGSNFSRGIAAALLGEIDIKGNLDADIAVLELDEAHAVNFVDKIPPKYSLILNVMRDQLDRFGEIDHTAKLLRHIANKTTDTVVLNRDDAKIAQIARSLDKQKVSFFGIDQKLMEMFPSDDQLHRNSAKQNNNIKAEVILSKVEPNKALFLINNKKVETSLALTGVYNAFNAAAAIMTTVTIIGEKINQTKLIKDLSKIEPAFGRGEKIMLKGQPIDLVLVKNPSGFRLGLKSFSPYKCATMIAINDEYADGRDMSWLWDVDFTSLKESGVAQISGTRAYDMALRLDYDDVKFSNTETDLKKALKNFIDKYPKSHKRIYCTYTAMIAIRKELSKITNTKAIR